MSSQYHDTVQRKVFFARNLPLGVHRCRSSASGGGSGSSKGKKKK